MLDAKISKLRPCEDNEALERFVQDVVTRATGRVPTFICQIPQGIMTHKFEVSLPTGDTLVVRIYPKMRANVVRYEPGLLIWAHEKGGLTPKVVYYERKSDCCEHSYVIYHKIRGVTLERRIDQLSDRKLANILAEVFDRLRCFSSLEIIGFGRLRQTTLAKHNSWPSFVDDAFQRRLSPGVFSSRTLKQLDRIQLSVRSIAALERGSFAWGDLSPSNILLDADDRVTGIIDLESAFAADQYLMFGYAHARWYGSRFWAAVLNVMTTQPGSCIQLVHFYSMLRGLRMAIHVHKPLPTCVAQRSIRTVLPGVHNAIGALSKNRTLGRSYKI